MQQKIVTQLLAINRRFYNEFAASFSASRGPTEPGLERAFEQLKPGAHILDLGCGQGRIAQLAPAGAVYVGVDYASEMLRVAAEEADDATASGVETHFVVADLLQDPWEERVMPFGPFDWIVLRAVLHHIPGYENRLKIIRRAAQMLAPEGRILVANWQFLKIDRLRRRVLPWSEIGLTVDDVEPNDYLLDWRRGGRALRYVHLVDEEETRRLAEDADLELVTLYSADGHTNDLTLYAIMSPSF